MPVAKLHEVGGRSALIAGATGLVGGFLLRRLEADASWARVIVAVRRPVGLGGGRVHEVVLDYDRLEEAAGDLRADHVFCALGTTLRKAGSREAFRRVDHDYPLELARLAAGWNARHFSLVSSLGADPEARLFYPRVKGEVEVAVRQVGLRSLTILRPSVLLGSRSELRPAEAAGKVLSLLIPGRYRGVSAGAVAAAMVALAERAEPGTRVLESEEIRRLAAAAATPASG